MLESLSWPAIIAAFVFVFSKSYEVTKIIWDDKKEKEKYIRSLFAEIDFNTRDMEIFISDSAPINLVKEKLIEDSSFLPHVTDSRHTDIYKSQINLIHHISDDYLPDVVSFYSIMNQIGVEVSSIYRPSFKKISIEGQVSTIKDLYVDSRECSRIGRKILDTMKDKYPNYKLKRKIRPAPSEHLGAGLEERFELLDLNLERAWAIHRENSIR
ncbi:hypothetical protein [Breoghania sp.]|uniref:hypothetical protein n=1 Tax=Breoghania sp. TaxID=2065378 RepID=UPI002AA64243|nr:hypothetical protein [Breoghania sp.]